LHNPLSLGLNCHQHLFFHIKQTLAKECAQLDSQGSALLTAREHVVSEALIAISDYSNVSGIVRNLGFQNAGFNTVVSCGVCVVEDKRQIQLVDTL